MTGAKLAVVHPHPEVALATLALVATFAFGLAAGLNLPRLGADEGLTTGASTTKPFVGVAFNNMSDAARRARYGPIAFKGVADNNMSDAARRARYGPMAFTGVADNNMSDAAWAAMYDR
jgi:hypothetical protein